MELLLGGELLDAVLAKGSYSEADARLCFVQLLRGVHYLHSRRVPESCQPYTEQCRWSDRFRSGRHAAGDVACWARSLGLTLTLSDCDASVGWETTMRSQTGRPCAQRARLTSSRHSTLVW